jgi:hypothetical protein
MTSFKKTYNTEHGSFSITPLTEGFLLEFSYNSDLVHDLKLLPPHARRWVKDRRAWWVSGLYFPGVADFLMAHFGVDLTPERNNPAVPAIELLGRAE